MAAVLNFDRERGGKSKSSTALISDAIEGRDDALLLYLDNLVKRFREYAKKHVTVLVPVATLGPLVTAFAFIILKAKGIW